MKRVLAWTAYIFGTTMAIHAVVSGSFTGLLFGLAWWWIGAGIGIRLGMEPYEFVDGVRDLLGIVRPSDDRSDHNSPTV